MIYLLLFIIGTIFGSFFHVYGTRLARNESLIKPGSHCEFCNKNLKWYDLIPIISFIFNKGRCKYCKEKLPLSYIIIEILTGFLFSYNYRIFGLSYEFGISLIITYIIIIIYVSDFKYYIILDSPMIIGGLFILLFFYLDTHSFMFLFRSIFNGTVLFILMYAIKLLGDKLFNAESLGGGDIKFAFIIGLCLGMKLGLISIVLACFLTFPYALFLVISKHQKEIPFGPFLGMSLYIVFIFSDKFRYIIDLLLNI